MVGKFFLIRLLFVVYLIKLFILWCIVNRVVFYSWRSQSNCFQLKLSRCVKIDSFRNLKLTCLCLVVCLNEIKVMSYDTTKSSQFTILEVINFITTPIRLSTSLIDAFKSIQLRVMAYSNEIIYDSCSRIQMKLSITLGLFKLNYLRFLVYSNQIVYDSWGIPFKLFYMKL